MTTQTKTIDLKVHYKLEQRHLKSLYEQLADRTNRLQKPQIEKEIHASKTRVNAYKARLEGEV